MTQARIQLTSWEAFAEEWRDTHAVDLLVDNLNDNTHK